MLSAVSRQRPGAQRDLAGVYPSAAEYHAGPGEGRNRDYTGDEFGGIIAFPLPKT